MEILAVAASLAQLVEGAIVVSRASRDVYTAYRSAPEELGSIEKQNEILRSILAEATTIHHRLRNGDTLGEYLL